MNKPDALTLVIFGASGDLTRRKLMPALYLLYKAGRLPRRFGQALPSSGSPPWCSPEPKDPQGSCRRQGRTGTGYVAPAANQNRKEEQAYTPCCRSG